MTTGFTEDQAGALEVEMQEHLSRETDRITAHAMRWREWATQLDTALRAMPSPACYLTTAYSTITIPMFMEFPREDIQRRIGIAINTADSIASALERAIPLTTQAQAAELRELRGQA